MFTIIRWTQTRPQLEKNVASCLLDVTHAQTQTFMSSTAMHSIWFSRWWWLVIISYPRFENVELLDFSFLLYCCCILITTTWTISIFWNFAVISTFPHAFPHRHWYTHCEQFVQYLQCRYIYIYILIVQFILVSKEQFRTIQNSDYLICIRFVFFSILKQVKSIPFISIFSLSNLLKQIWMWTASNVQAVAFTF